VNSSHDFSAADRRRVVAVDDRELAGPIPMDRFTTIGALLDATPGDAQIADAFARVLATSQPSVADLGAGGRVTFSLTTPQDADRRLRAIAAAASAVGQRVRRFVPGSDARRPWAGRGARPAPRARRGAQRMARRECPGGRPMIGAAFTARAAFRVAYGLVRAHRAAHVAGFGTRTQVCVTMAFSRVVNGLAAIESDAWRERACDALDRALDAAERCAR
jgi:hypothetical protein